MAEFYVRSDMTQAIAKAFSATAGSGAILGVPLFAGIAGFLTGGVSAANAMLMPTLTALAHAAAIDHAWISAIQNSVCANVTMLSPVRVSMGAAILSLAGSDAALYRRAWPLALPPVLIGLAAVVALLVAA
jgi:lactate permease